MSNYDHEQLSRLIGMLPPAPVGWVQAAQELPAARRGLDQSAQRDLSVLQGDRVRGRVRVRRARRTQGQKSYGDHERG